jgi:hypothetical protein
MENVAGTVSVELSSFVPEFEVTYLTAADIAFLDETLYVHAAYVESEGDVGEIEAGWQVCDASWKFRSRSKSWSCMNSSLAMMR